MNSGDSSRARNADGEVASLIETLHATGRRLEELTDGEVDAVADRHGQTFVLRRAQEQLRQIETAKQAALLNALPAHVALLDAHGVIVAVNEAWRQFARANGIQGPGSTAGASYLDVCDTASGDGATEARQAAEGIRGVLRGTARRFSLEYPCHSPDEQRWFRMIVTPLAGAPPTGAVVMHLDLSAERQALRESERRFSDLLQNVQLAAVMLDCEGRITYCNEYLLRLTGWRNEDVIGHEWIDLFIPPGSEGLHALFAALIADRPEALQHENEILMRSGERRLFSWSNSVLRSSAGDVIGTASIGEDITDRSRLEATLQQTQERTRSIVESALDAVVVMDARGCIVDWNPQAEKTFGWLREQVVGKLVSETIIPARGRAAHDLGLRTFLETGASPLYNQRIEISAIHRDGRELPVEVAVAPVEVEGAWMFSAFIRDLTASKESETRIRRLNRVHAVLSAINTLIVRVGDRDELFREASRVAIEDGKFRMAWIGMADKEAGRIVPIASAGDVGDFLDSARLDVRAGGSSGFGLAGQAMQELQPMVSNDVGNDPERINKEQMAARGINSVAVIPLSIAGEAVGVLALYAADTGFFDDAEMRLLQELAGNISFAIDHIHKRELLDHLAYYDALTGLANRSLFLDRVTQYIHSAASGEHKLAVYLIDLERFKNLNDSLGRPAGDALLRQVAEWLTRHVGDANLVARVGADEFAVVLPQVLPEEVGSTVWKSMEAFLEHPFRLNDAVFRIAAKAGVALFPDDGAAADTLFKNAEAALKKAKTSGDRYLSYTQAMNATVAGKLTLENQLRQALDERQFVLHYQPKVSLATGKLTGAEALIRWNDPRTGLVPPGRFIPVLEETGLIYEVGRWALRQAIGDYLRWRTMGLDALRIAVNVSPLQLRNAGFIEELRQAVGIDPHAAAGVELEITESVIMEDARHSIASLHAIRSMGLTVAIDDFGTGFSSLSYLAKLPVDTLKIDRSFVVDMTASPQGLALVSTIINLAHSLKLKVVAEGVETDEQSRLLRLLDCDEMQGFLFGRPVAFDVFEKTYLSA